MTEREKELIVKLAMGLADPYEARRAKAIMERDPEALELYIRELELEKALMMAVFLEAPKPEGTGVRALGWAGAISAAWGAGLLFLSAAFPPVKPMAIALLAFGFGEGLLGTLLGFARAR